jgi:membrane-bound lytic murein transglycosylase D
MASYNGGPGRVQRALSRSRKDDFWAVSANTRYLPRETREYVPMILAAIVIAKNPSQYGFEVLPMVAPATEPVLVPQAVDLRRIAEWAGVAVDDIQRLNPELRRWMTPIRAGEYAVNVPAGTAARVQEGLSASAESQLNALQWHTVKKGESLASIAKKLRVSRTDLAEANYLKTTSRVQAGQRLVVPRMPSAAVLAASAAGAPVDPAVALAASAPVEDAEPVIYRVRAGDTLYAIARRYGASVDQLKAWNRIRGSKLNIGDRLLVSAPRTANAQQ